ncbi:MAG: 30S ribosomal protein S4 [Candidatus Micrarchaeia archaeon]
MGDPKRLRKLYERPMRLWDKERIERENKLKEEFGLKNTREVWRAQTDLRKIRRDARRLLSLKGKKIEERTQNLLKRVKSFLIDKPNVSLDDILALEVRDVLERRLQTVVSKKGLAKTAKQSRQIITHGHIAIDDKRVNVPSYRVKFNEESKIGWYGKPVSLEAKPPSEKEEAPAKEAQTPKEQKTPVEEEATKTPSEKKEEAPAAA